MYIFTGIWVCTSFALQASRGEWFLDNAKLYYFLAINYFYFCSMLISVLLELLELEGGWKKEYVLMWVCLLEHSKYVLSIIIYVHALNF